LETIIMLTDSERFAFETRRHHAFASTGNAYDASQCDEAIRTGDTLIVLAEQVVAIAMTWPFAVTETSGALHALSAPKPGEDLAALARSLHVERPTSDTPLTSPAVWDLRSTRSWCRCSTCLPGDPGSLRSERQRGLRLEPLAGRRGNRIGNHSGELERGVLAQA